MPGKLSTSITKLLQACDELSLQNIRGALWSAVLVFPLSVIMGDLRYFDMEITVAWLLSCELLLLPLGWVSLF